MFKTAKHFLSELKNGQGHNPRLAAADLLKYIGPGLLVTIGFIDPGNWASNLAAGSAYGYSLLWVITLSTIMLVLLQHNAAHLGIATGLCLSEAAVKSLKPWVSGGVLTSAMIASISTSMAEVLGGAIALQMLFHVPLRLGAVMICLLVFFLLFTNSYRTVEKWIIGFVSLIGLSFVYELALAPVEWSAAARSWVVPCIPHGSMVIVMSLIGAVVMPHNLFLHSEIIQSRQWNLGSDTVIRKQLRYEFMDTLFSMGVGWAINSAMIILAAATFFKTRVSVTELSQARELLTPLLGLNASNIFAIALLFAGIASAVTSGMAGGSIFTGIFHEPYDIKDSHSKTGVAISLGVATLAIFFITNPFKGLIYSQMLLSMQLPITIFLQIYLTSSKQLMGKFVCTRTETVLLSVIGAVISGLNIMLLLSFFTGA